MKGRKDGVVFTPSIGARCQHLTFTKSSGVELIKIHSCVGVEPSSVFIVWGFSASWALNQVRITLGFSSLPPPSLPPPPVTVRVHQILRAVWFEQWILPCLWCKVLLWKAPVAFLSHTRHSDLWDVRHICLAKVPAVIRFQSKCVESDGAGNSTLLVNWSKKSFLKDKNWQKSWTSGTKLQENLWRTCAKLLKSWRHWR